MNILLPLTFYIFINVQNTLLKKVFIFARRLSLYFKMGSSFHYLHLCFYRLFGKRRTQQTRRNNNGINNAVKENLVHKTPILRLKIVEVIRYTTMQRKKTSLIYFFKKVYENKYQKSQLLTCWTSCGSESLAKNEQKNLLKKMFEVMNQWSPMVVDSVKTSTSFFNSVVWLCQNNNQRKYHFLLNIL